MEMLTTSVSQRPDGLVHFSMLSSVPWVFAFRRFKVFTSVSHYFMHGLDCSFYKIYFLSQFLLEIRCHSSWIPVSCLIHLVTKFLLSIILSSSSSYCLSSDLDVIYPFKSLMSLWDLCFTLHVRSAGFILMCLRIKHIFVGTNCCFIFIL